MNKISLLGMCLFFLTQNVFGQNDFVLTKSNDTIYATIKAWNNSVFKPYVKVESNGNTKKYYAKELIEFRSDSVYYEVARICPTLIGFKKNMFLRRVLTGKINLYGIGVTDHFSSSNTVGSTTIKEYKSVSVTVGYIRKTTEAKKKYHKLFSYKKVSRLVNDCPDFKKLFPKSAPNKDYPYDKQIFYYNDLCK